MGVVDSDFYEWETHVFFDDAFELGDNDEEQQVANSNKLARFELIYLFSTIIVVA